MKKLIFFIIVVLFLSIASWASAYTVQDLPNTEVTNDLLLSPGKTELLLVPGGSVTKEIFITNRLGKNIEIKIEVEDFTGSENSEEVIVLLGEGKGVRSLKDYAKPEIKEFVLSHGQKMSLPIEISIPEDAEPGGLYGAVIVSAQPVRTEEEGGAEEVEPGAKFVTRLGSLFFVRVSGEAFEDGWLRKFDTKVGKRFFQKGPVSFEILFENKGNVHLAPYGFIEIKDLLGRQAGFIDIDPWFVMPDSLRAREVRWSKDIFFGRYEARLKINRGYGNVIDEAVVIFWVLPWKMLLITFVTLILFGIGLRWFVGKFEIRRK